MDKLVTIGANILKCHHAQFNIAGNRVLSVSGSQSLPDSNIFAGVDAGASNTTGVRNAFFGESAGAANTAGHSNASFGSGAGLANTMGTDNAFFGLIRGYFSLDSECSFLATKPSRIKSAISLAVPLTAQ